MSSKVTANARRRTGPCLSIVGVPADTQHRAMRTTIRSPEAKGLLTKCSPLCTGSKNAAQKRRSSKRGSRYVKGGKNKPSAPGSQRAQLPLSVLDASVRPCCNAGLP